MQGPSTAICVVSYDGGEDLWRPFFDAFHAAWPDCPLPLYLVTNHKTYADTGYVTSLKTGEDIDWSTNMLKALDLIPHDRVLFIFDDFLPRHIDGAGVLQHIATATAQDWPYLTLYPNNYRRAQVSRDIQQIAEQGVYRCTLVYGLFRKDYLAALLKPGENAWEFEIESGKRARGTPLYSVSKPLFKHYHLLRKGMWMRPGYPKVAQSYPLDTTRPVESIPAYIKREIKEWLFRKYHRLMPPALIERRESRRKPD